MYNSPKGRYTASSMAQPNINGGEKYNPPLGITVFEEQYKVLHLVRSKGRGYEYICIYVGKFNRGGMRKSLSEFFNFQQSMW